MPRPRLEVADVFRRHGEAWREAQAGHLSRAQLRVMSAIESCRTAALGGHVEQCVACAHTRIAYNSCRNRHCPKCQGSAASAWLAARTAELLPVPYFHVVFTLPAQLGAIAYPHWARSVAPEPQERYANRPWLLWQYTAAGRVAGIPTEVDLNAFYGGRADWAKFVASSCDPRFAAQGACNGQNPSAAAQDTPESRPKAAFDRLRPSPDQRAHLEHADQG